MARDGVKQEQPTVEPKQRWDRNGNTARVMAVVEGYVVYRFKGSGPGLMYWRDFEKNFARRPA